MKSKEAGEAQKKTYWQEHIKAWRQSGLSQAHFWWSWAGSAIFSLFRLQVRDSRFDAARYLLRMVFCPSKSEWKAMRLPSSLTFGYWVVRPFRILWSGVAGTIAGKWRDLN